MARRGVRVSHCIESNLKLASGIAPVHEMLEAGVSVSLGTDGAASNNDLDLFGEMRTAALVHKGVALDLTVLSAREVLHMATVEGAKVFGLPGTLAPGNPADIVVLDGDKPHLSPTYDICSHLVYSARGSDVVSVIVAGKLLVDKGVVLVLDEAEIIKAADVWRGRISDFMSGREREG